MSRKDVAVVLWSGGIDSTVCVYEALERGFDVFGLHIFYSVGDFARAEEVATSNLARHLRDHESFTTLTHSSTSFFGGPLSDPDAKTPTMFLPGRNVILLGLAAMYAMRLYLGDLAIRRHIYIGANQDDRRDYPDCTPIFLKTYEDVLVSAGLPVELETPLLHMAKKDIILRGNKLGIPFELTHTCYTPGPNGAACATCAACKLRVAAFNEVGLFDPIKYGG